MFGLSAQQRYFLYAEVVDMRKSFDGLSGIVTGQMGKDVCSGDVYIFLGKDLSRIKLLVWEQGGFVLYYKRLEAGTFALPRPGQGSIVLTDRGALFLPTVSCVFWWKAWKWKSAAAANAFNDPMLHRRRLHRREDLGKW